MWPLPAPTFSIEGTATCASALAACEQLLACAVACALQRGANSNGHARTNALPGARHGQLAVVRALLQLAAIASGHTEA